MINKYLNSIALLITCLCSSSLFGQDVQTVAEIDFDKNPAMYDYCFAFAGYGDAQSGKSVLVKDQVKANSQPGTSGFDPMVTDLMKQSRELTSKLGAEHAEVVKVKKMLAEKQAADNACTIVTLDSSNVKIPGDSSYDYVGWGVGVCYQMDGKKLPGTELAKYTVSFNAKVSGTATLMGSKFRCGFIVEDDKLKVDEDDNDDVLFGLIRGQENGDDCISITSEYKNFSFPLDQLNKHEGSWDAVKDVELKGVVFTIQAQGDAVDIGNDTDNVLHVDNFRLTYSGK